MEETKKSTELTIDPSTGQPLFTPKIISKVQRDKNISIFEELHQKGMERHAIRQ
jgi:hypothetical protein